MVYAGAVQKTLAYMTLSLVLGFSAITLLSGDLSGNTGTTARVVSDVSYSGAEITSNTFVVLFLGIMIGALAVGTLVYVLHYEKKRMQ